MMKKGLIGVVLTISLLFLTIGCTEKNVLFIPNDFNISDVNSFADVNFLAIFQDLNLFFPDVNNALYLNGVPGSGYIRTDGSSTTTATIPFSAGSTKGLSLTGLKQYCSTTPGDVSCDFVMEAGKTRLDLPKTAMQGSLSMGENLFHVGIADAGYRIWYDDSTVPELVLSSEDFTIQTSGVKITGMPKGVLDVNMSIIPRERNDTNIGSDSNRWNTGFFQKINATNFCLPDGNCFSQENFHHYYTPTGMKEEYPGRTTCPSGRLPADGSCQSVEQYSDLNAQFQSVFGSCDTGVGEGSGFRMPDFRSRVTVGAGTGTEYDGNTLSNYDLNQWGGQESVILTIAQLAAHGHSLLVSLQAQSKLFPSSGTASNIWTVGLFNNDTTQVGSNEPHNNLPPYGVALVCIVT